MTKLSDSDSRQAERVYVLVKWLLSDIHESIRIPLSRISSTVLRNLYGAGIQTVYDLVSNSEEDLLKIKGIGNKSAHEITKALVAAAYVHNLSPDNPADPMFREALKIARYIRTHWRRDTNGKT